MTECRDGHFLGVIKKRKTIILAHRNQDRKDLPDDDDLHFTIPEAKKLYHYLKELNEFKKEVKEKTGKITISVLEIDINPVSPENKKWIGLKQANNERLLEEFQITLKKQRKLGA